MDDADRPRREKERLLPVWVWLSIAVLFSGAGLLSLSILLGSAPAPCDPSELHCKLKDSFSEAQVMGVLGTPQKVAPGMLDETEWTYYTLSFDGFDPAPSLDVTFSSDGIVRAWGFTDNHDKSALPISESLEQGDARRRDFLAQSGACFLTRRIDISESIQNGATNKTQIQSVFGAPESQRLDPATGNVVWSYYASKAAALFWPADEFDLSFDAGGHLLYWAPGGASGCALW
jgi:outer membrane protein assembly factor BamE (lipoprotein component of BamABCDE complex)